MKSVKKGFTLIELLVVIAIIGLLSSVVLASLNIARIKAGDSKIKAQLVSFRSGADLYFSNNGGYSDGGAAPATFNSSGMPIPSGQGDIFDSLGGNTLHTHLLSSNLPQGSKVFYTRDGPSVGVKATEYAVAVSLGADPDTAWCVDSTGASKQETKSTLGGSWVVTDLFSSNACK